VTSGGGLGGGIFRLSFGLVKEIAAGLPSLEQARLRELVVVRGLAPGARWRSSWAPDHPQARAAYAPPSLVVGIVSGDGPQRLGWWR
jgi:hypothetical protein